MKLSLSFIVKRICLTAESLDVNARTQSSVPRSNLQDIGRDSPSKKDAWGFGSFDVSGARIERVDTRRTFDGSHDPAFAFTLYLRRGVWRYRRYITVCATRVGMPSSRLSPSRFISPCSLTRVFAGERARERVIAALAHPLGFRLGSISNSAVSHSLRRNEMPLPHSVYQPDPTCVRAFPHFFSPLFPSSIPRTYFELTEPVPPCLPSHGTSTESTVLRPWIG